MMKKIVYCSFLMLNVLLLITACKKPSCSNNIKDGKELGVDCGGHCPVCVEKSNVTPTASQTPSSSLIGVWYYIRRTRISEPYYSNTARIDLNINVNANCKTELTDILNSDSTKKSYGSFGSCSYPVEDSWTYDSTSYLELKTGAENSYGGFDVLYQTANSLHLKMAYYDLYYSKSVSPYQGIVPQVQVELKILSVLPANALIADGDTLSAGQTLWTKTYMGSGSQAHFVINVERPSNSPATGDITFQMLVKDSNGKTLAESYVISTKLEGYPPPPPPITDGPPLGGLDIKYDIKWE